MANLAYANIRKRLREVLDDGEGLVRTVPASKFSGDYWTGADPWTGQVRALSKPRFALPTMTTVPVAGSPMQPGSSNITELEVRVECEYALTVPVAADDTRDAAVAQAEQDGDIITQAFGWPGNLTQTEAAAATGILDGVIRHVVSRPIVEDWARKRLVMSHTYRAFVNTVQATS